MSKPYLVGVTGGIGSGKSTLCKVYEILGSKCYYADDRAKQLMENNQDLITKITVLFGAEAYVDGRLNRKEIGRQVFRNQALLEQLNQLVHPAVKDDFRLWVEENRNVDVLLKEAALLFETGSYKELDRTILVTADREVRMQRVLHRDSHRSKEDVIGIMDKQLPDTQKSVLADYIVSNDGSNSLIKQALDIYKKLSPPSPSTF
ncbi:MAG: dephospho-CoA kinase [Bacteroidota bacterium]